MCVRVFFFALESRRRGRVARECSDAHSRIFLFVVVIHNLFIRVQKTAALSAQTTYAHTEIR